MLHVWQMNDGRWHVDALTSAPETDKRAAARAPGFDTRAEAEAWVAAQRPAYAEELTPEGPQLVIPGCERATVKAGSTQLNLFA